MGGRRPLSRSLDKRQLSVYNFGISTRGKINQPHMYMWTECQGQRGSNEICSAILLYLEEKLASGEIKHLHSFSDGCGGQNRNKNVMALMSLVVEKFDVTWTHSFLETGHTFLPNDREFSKISVAKKRSNTVYSLDQYVEIMPKKYRVQYMEGKFLNFKELQKSLTFRHCDQMNNKFLLSQVKWMKFERGEPKICHFKYTNSVEQQPFALSLMPRCDRL